MTSSVVVTAAAEYALDAVAAGAYDAAASAAATDDRKDDTEQDARSQHHQQYMPPFGATNHRANLQFATAYYPVSDSLLSRRCDSLRLLATIIQIQ